MSGGQIALKQLGIPIKRYYAFEIKKTAIEVTQLNFPNTIQIGDIENITVEDIKEMDKIITHFL